MNAFSVSLNVFFVLACFFIENNSRDVFKLYIFFKKNAKPEELLYTIIVFYTKKCPQCCDYYTTCVIIISKSRYCDQCAST